MVKMQDCKRWEFCNANICPFDPEWRRRSHLSGEAVCLWLRELSKPGGESVLSPTLLDGEHLGAVRVCLDEIMQHGKGGGDAWGAIQAVLKRASTQSSKIATGRARFSPS